MTRDWDQNEEGFTLVELMVVVLVISILLAIAVPTFLTASSRTRSRAATSNLRSALSAVKSVYVQYGTYESVAAGAPVTETSLNAATPAPGWGSSGGAAPSPSTAPTEMSWQGQGNVMLLASRSQDGTCYFLRDDVNAGGGISFAVAEVDPCVAGGFAGPWSSSASDAGW